MVEKHSNYRSWDIEPLTGGPDKRDLYLNLAGFAILAASTHNVQPWRFIIRPSENIIDLCLDRAGVLPVSDKNSRQAYISIGCALENLLLAAEYYGLNPEMEYSFNSFYPQPAVRLIFNENSQLRFGDSKFILPPSRGMVGGFIQAMKNRKMNRGKFKPKIPVPEMVLESISRLVKDRGLGFYCITDALTRFAIAQFQYNADRVVVAQNDFRHELSVYFLPNDSGQSRGMPGNTFGLSDEMAARIHEELKKEGSFDADLAAGFASSSRDGIKSSPLIGIITAKEDSPEWWLKSGMVFQRIALLAELNGLGLAILASIVEVEAANKTLKIRLKSKQRPTVIFRLGYPVEERPHSPRANIEEVAEVIE